MLELLLMQKKFLSENIQLLRDKKYYDFISKEYTDSFPEISLGDINAYLYRKGIKLLDDLKVDGIPVEFFKSLL